MPAPAAIAVDRLALGALRGGGRTLHGPGRGRVRGPRREAHRLGRPVQWFSKRGRPALVEPDHAGVAGRRAGAGQPRGVAVDAAVVPEPRAGEVAGPLSRGAWTGPA